LNPHALKTAKASSRWSPIQDALDYFRAARRHVEAERLSVLQALSATVLLEDFVTCTSSKVKYLARSVSRDTRTAVSRLGSLTPWTSSRIGRSPLTIGITSSARMSAIMGWWETDRSIRREPRFSNDLQAVLNGKVADFKYNQEALCKVMLDDHSGVICYHVDAPR
jgi:hypothetical protein